MRDYTVIGFYESTNQTFAHHVTATSALHAFTVTAARLEREDTDPDDCIFVVAVPGHLRESDGDLMFPGEGLVDITGVIDQPDVFG